ncbi:MAG: hypothetical protein H6555_04380 [Lewinellaceae bacterium]|nr:hypothetical protein [Lewinellaceae bacterium]
MHTYEHSESQQEVRSRAITLVSQALTKVGIHLPADLVEVKTTRLSSYLKVISLIEHPCSFPLNQYHCLLEIPVVNTNHRSPFGKIEGWNFYRIANRPHE